MQSVREFHPEMIPRKGERIAWLLFVIALALLGVSLWSDGKLSWMAVALVALLFFSGGSISLGNWVDRQTVLRLSPTGVSFRNGLRDVSLNWNDIQSVRVLDSGWGERVRVAGSDGGFTFRTLGEVWMQGELKGRVGFAEGEAILKDILQNSGLKLTEIEDKVSYYSRP